MQKLLLLSSLLFFTSCASAGIHTPSADQPLRVSLLTQGGASRFEIANAAHTDPVELYSRPRTQGSTMKVAPDAVVLDMIDYLGSHGYGDHERRGSVSKAGVAAYARAFEIESSAGISHWGLTRGSDIEELKAMTKCFDYFFNEVFNQIEAYQTVENQDGDFQFKEK